MRPAARVIPARRHGGDPRGRAAGAGCRCISTARGCSTPRPISTCRSLEICRPRRFGLVRALQGTRRPGRRDPRRRRGIHGQGAPRRQDAGRRHAPGRADRGAGDRRAQGSLHRAPARPPVGAAGSRAGLPPSMRSLVEVERVQTNIVNCFVDRFAERCRGRSIAQLRQRGILANAQEHQDPLRHALSYRRSRSRRRDRRGSPRSSSRCGRRPDEHDRPVPRADRRFESRIRSSTPATSCTGSSSEQVQQALERSGFDAFLFFKAEAVRYITDFYVKGFRPFMEPEYVVLVARGQAAGRRLHLRQRRPAHPVQVRHRGRAQAAGSLRTGP